MVFAATSSATAESWSFTGSLQQARLYPSATLLPNGQVLVAGGYHRGLIVGVAELYNPATGTLTGGPSLNTPRRGHRSVLLTNGQVLAAGGYESQLGSCLGYLASAELFHSTTRSGTARKPQSPKFFLMPGCPASRFCDRAFAGSGCAG